MKIYINVGNSILTNKSVCYMENLIKYEIPIMTTKKDKLKYIYGYCHCGL